MSVDALPYSYVIAPILMVIGAIFIFAPMLPATRTWARVLVAGLVAGITIRYLHWRIWETVVPVEGSTLELSWVWLCFGVELLAFMDAAILYVGFLRTTNRLGEADAHETRLRAAPPHSLPSVDVFITTYNEPFELLEKTIVAALSLDYPNFSLWVLDDGRRPWLKQFCEVKGVGYITRPNNEHGKAGNINRALALTDGDYIAVFDADFIVQRNFLMRTLGFFQDPAIGIVQVPHAFYNNEPMQANLGLRKALPDDQRFFFEAIMPSRDGWDAAFCCGSNSVTRRSTLRAIGGALPTGSITEDMLLSLALLRKGFVTRYLCERLAFGLAPESVTAFFVQRQRWVRGAMQILHLPEGPLGRGLRLMHRLLFLPTHWLSQSLMLLMSIAVPVVFLWTGLEPLVNVTTESVLHYLLPTVLAVVGGIRFYAQQQYFPLSAQVLGTFQAFKILPTAVATLIKPKGHVFRVTPKGRSAMCPGYERGLFWTSATLMFLTVGGAAINAFPDYRIVEQGALIPLVSSWCALNVVVLFLVCMVCVQQPVRRSEERFTLDEPIWISAAAGSMAVGRLKDLSISGAAIEWEVMGGGKSLFERGSFVRIFISDVGFIAGTVARTGDGFISVHFQLPASVERDLLIRKVFTSGLDMTAVTTSIWSATFALIKGIWGFRSIADGFSAAENPETPIESLPAQTYMLPPSNQRVALDQIAKARATLAA